MDGIVEVLIEFRLLVEKGRWSHRRTFLPYVDFVGDEGSSRFFQDIFLDQTTFAKFDFHSCREMVDVIDEVMIEKWQTSFDGMSHFWAISVDFQESIQKEVLREDVLTAVNTRDLIVEHLLFDGVIVQVGLVVIETIDQEAFVFIVQSSIERAFPPHERWTLLRGDIANRLNRVQVTVVILFNLRGTNNARW